MDVSIILPIYNVEQYLGDCFESLLSQKKKEFEIIAINDGSSDNSFEIIKEYSKKFKNFRIINQENVGLAQSRNIGIDIAEGKYILFLDSDDLLTHDAINKLYNFANENALDLVVYDAIAFDDRSGKKDYKKYSRKKYFKKDIMDLEEYLSYSLKKTVLISQLHFYKSDIIKKNRLRFREGLLHEDEHFSICSYRLINKIGYLSDPLYLRRYRSNSIMTGNLYNNNKSLKSYKWILSEFSRMIEEGKFDIQLKKLVEKRSALLLSNLIRYSNFNLVALIKLSRQLKIKILHRRVLANLIIFKILNKNK